MNLEMQLKENLKERADSTAGKTTVTLQQNP